MNKYHRLPFHISSMIFLMIGFSSGYFYSLYNTPPSDTKYYVQKSAGYHMSGNRDFYTVQLIDDDPKTIDALDGIILSVLRLAKLLSKDDPKAIQLVFNLLQISDGASAESIHIQLGEIIKRNPRLFLELLKKNYSTTMDLPGLLGNLGSDFIDKPAKNEVEIKERIDAISSVKDKDLEKIKEKVLEGLQS